MNIVETITHQISGPVLGQLSSSIGMTETTTRSAVGAAVPSLLSSFSGLASTAGGAQKLAGALERFDPRSPGSMAGLMNERPEIVAERGSGLAESLLGSGGVSGIAGSLTRFFGIGSGGAGRLLGFLTPMVLGGIARQFSGKSISAEGLTSFFSQQKRHISGALPAGFAGAESAVEEGAARAGGAARNLARSAQPRPNWLFPAVLGLAAMALVLFLIRQKPSAPVRSETPDVSSRLGQELNNTVGSLTGTLSGITDAATAEAAIPKLVNARGKLDEIRAKAAQLPQEGRAKFDRWVQPHVGELQKQSERVASIPGAGEKIKPVLDDLISRLGAPVGGAPAEEGQQEVK